MSRSLQAIVSADWLDTQVRLPAAGGLTVIDVRWEEEYAAGHVPESISIPYGIQSAWSESGDELLLELPPDQQLFDVIGGHGLTPESRVVVLGRVEETMGPRYGLADPVRVAATLMYAGIQDVAVLSGGHTRWENEGRRTTTDVPAISPRVYRAVVDRDTWVSTDYVKQRMGTCVLLDAREPDQYFGTSIDPFADMRGHIPTARNLPAAWLWGKDGSFRSSDEIRAMAVGVLGEDKSAEIITYCGIGGYASAWWFVLTQLLGYEKVRIYDGSMEAWVAEENRLVQYSWMS